MSRKFPRHAAATWICLALLLTAGMLRADEPFPTFQQKLNDRGRTVKVVCFGDSVTGVYYHTGGRRAYPKLIEIALQKTNPRAEVQVINAGISGHTTRDALNRIEKDVLAQRPDLVTVMFGLNDMTRVPIEEYRKNLAEIIRQCRAVGADVLLCTPNSVRDTPSRPTDKLEDYVAAVRQVAEAEKVDVADCYAAYQALRSREPFSWALLMSDEIHPNLDGHKLLAEEITRAIVGRWISLQDVPVSEPPLERLNGKLKQNQPVHVVAMPPYDAQVRLAIRKRFPTADIKITPWLTAGKSLSDIEEQAKKVREMAPDAVVLDIPAEVSATTPEQYVQTMSWVLNYCLSFGHREWDVFVIDPGLAGEPAGNSQRERAQLIRRLVRAQDLPLISRPAESTAKPAAVFTDWMAAHLPPDLPRPTIKIIFPRNKPDEKDK